MWRDCSIYDRATRAVADEDRFDMFMTYAAKAEEYYGVTKTRDIFEKAIEVLPEKEVLTRTHAPPPPHPHPSIQPLSLYPRPHTAASATCLHTCTVVLSRL